METVDLAAEMAAARQRRAEQTARLLREARVATIRGAVRPGSTRAEIEERGRSCYPRLSEELLQEAISTVCAMQGVSSAPPAVPPAEEEP